MPIAPSISDDIAARTSIRTSPEPSGSIVSSSFTLKQPQSAISATAAQAILRIKSFRCFSNSSVDIEAKLAHLRAAHAADGAEGGTQLPLILGAIDEGAHVRHKF